MKKRLRLRRIKANQAKDAKGFWKRYNTPIPNWWPKHDDGHLVSHVYRLIDDDQGVDLVFPKVDNAMSDKLKENRVVNFDDASVRNLALRHDDKCSEGNFGARYFLSTMLDIWQAIEFWRVVPFAFASNLTMAYVAVRVKGEG